MYRFHFTKLRLAPAKDRKAGEDEGKHICGASLLSCRQLPQISVISRFLDRFIPIFESEIAYLSFSSHPGKGGSHSPQPSRGGAAAGSAQYVGTDFRLVEKLSDIFCLYCSQQRSATMAGKFTRPLQHAHQSWLHANIHGSVQEKLNCG